MIWAPVGYLVIGAGEWLSHTVTDSCSAEASKFNLNQTDLANFELEHKVNGDVQLKSESESCMLAHSGLIYPLKLGQDGCGTSI